MATYGELTSRILRMLGDPEGEGYSELQVLDAIQAATDAVLPWTPKTSVITLTGDGATTAYALPSDAYAIETIIVDASGEMLPPSIIAPGNYIGSNTTGVNSWILYPSGKVTLSKAISTSDTYTVFYLATWTKPTISTNDDDDLDTPDVVLHALTLYASGWLLTSASIESAEVRQFGTRVDSGNPEHNPLMESSEWLFKLFLNEMKRNPRYQKAQL